MNPEVSKYMSQLGKKSAAKLSPEERKEKARKAIKARWDKQKQKKDEKAPE